ncbi:MAG: phosphoenolpyruvate--protein phosphotransferase [Spirochaetales bacterium]|nr:phosphoenolpyruvate--protein phosphotransferase [Spirochaetales bacterium]
MTAIPLSSGISQGKVHRIKEELSFSRALIAPESVTDEGKRFRKGRDKAALALTALVEKVRREMGEDKAEIFEGHLEILTSEDVEEGVMEIITERLVTAEYASELFAEENAREMEELEDAYFRERGQDFRDIGKQLIKGISGEEEEVIELPPHAIVVGEELTPTQTASLDLSRVSGFIVKRGGKNSHAAIIARSMEIPAIMISDDKEFFQLKPGLKISFDGDTGEVWFNPGKSTVGELEKRDRRNKKEKEELLKILELPSQTTDGKKIGLFANVGGLLDVESAVKYNADGIGLFRTEFLFMETMQAPTLARQTQVYQAAIEQMKDRYVIIRLLDTGADKPLSYMPLPHEDNPFLGIRGIRLLLQREDVLRTQIQALLTASKAGSVGMMIPMINSLKPIERIRTLVEEEKAALNWTGPDNLKLGVMVETPAAVQMIKEILDKVDFVSIGSNDLTQYTLAADRGNPQMNEYYDEFHPAVLRAIAHTVRQANKKGVMNGICGELAGNPLALPFFIGLGVNELSCTASSLLRLKRIIRKTDSREAAALVEEILRIPTSEGIKARLNRFITERELMK